ncbi:hypothetical protein E3E12_08155 [Formicincola oecophyllae]|uniref:Uncharacterized protein n=1 Tax=Formicincola oecophyllae TaxID=2558361 RepID=A0A4Y6UC72_9PROT|nr:hypothetical protein [Formicincola oecophyllae]QDH14168.1 hypothetical protein E3E12_08155 [Formicincola oecophyllae]
MAADITNPATLPLAGAGAALNRIVGLQTLSDGSMGYSLYPLEVLSDKGAEIAWIAYNPTSALTPGQVEKGTLSIGTGDGNSYSTPLDLPPGAPGTPGKDGTPGRGIKSITVLLSGVGG